MSTEPAGIRETHTGLVVLAGDRAYKVKKAVRTPYCDFGSAALRRRALARELELNRRFAPDVYLGLGSFRSPDGATAEPVLVMRQMPADQSLTAALSCAGPDERDELVRSVARAVADAHRRAPRGDPGRAGPAALAARWSANLTRLRAGEALSAVLLQATELGLATCPLTEPLEVARTTEAVAERVLGGSLSPQVVLRVGWPSVAAPPPATPRRALVDQVDRRGTPRP